MRTISTQDKVIDSRDVDKRIEELEGELQARYETWQSDMVDGDDEISDDVARYGHHDARIPFKHWVEILSNDKDEVAAEYMEWVVGREEAQNITSEWEYGAGLIRADYFEDYAREFATEIGSLDPGMELRWPYTCIDWDQAAGELRMDYGSFEIGGVEYLVR